jgi:hypothetical protein
LRPTSSSFSSRCVCFPSGHILTGVLWAHTHWQMDAWQQTFATLEDGKVLQAPSHCQSFKALRLLSMLSVPLFMRKRLTRLHRGSHLGEGAEAAGGIRPSAGGGRGRLRGSEQVCDNATRAQNHDSDSEYAPARDEARSSSSPSRASVAQPAPSSASGDPFFPLGVITVFFILLP